MTPAERSSIANGIWLCQNCAGLIDRDPQTYTVAVLKNWRALAEIRAREELGQIPISREQYEAMHSVVFGKNPTHRLPDLVAAMCQLTVEDLERKDPRFKVEVERTRNQTTYTYLPRETVECSLSVRSDFAAEFLEKLSMLLRHGHELKIASGAIILEGSPLFEDFQGKDGVFVIGPSARRCGSVLIELIDDSGNKNFFAEIAGEILPGTESLRFQGKGLNDLFQLELNLPRDSTNTRVNSVLDFSIWNNREIATLPHFDRAWSYYECARAGRTIKLTIEAEGNRLAHLEGKIPSDDISNFALLTYLRNARIITAALGHSVSFTSNAKISWDDFEAINDLRLRVELTDPKGLESNPTMTLSPPSGKGIDYVHQYISSTVGLLRLEQECEGLVLFDQPLPAFKLVTSFSEARLIRVGKPRKGSVRAEIVPMNSCKLNCSIQKLP